MKETLPTYEPTIVMDHERETRDYLYRISQLTGLHSSTIYDKDLISIYDNTTFIRPKNFPNHLKEGYLGQYERGRAVSETIQRLGQLIEGYFDLDVIKISYGVFLPSYTRMLKAYRERSKREEHASLLIGALTLDTVKEYNYGINTVFEGAKTTIVDIAGEESAHYAQRHSDYHRADALDMPFPAENFDTAHTNYLLQHLHSEQHAKPVQKLLEQVQRVLKPGGSLVMVEGMGYSESQHLMNVMCNMGFEDITMTPAQSYKKRRDIDRHMRGAQCQPEAILEQKNALAIQAYKK